MDSTANMAVRGGRPLSAGMKDRHLSGGMNDSAINGERTGEMETPKCRCGEAAVKRTVKKKGPNRGREFFVCNKPQAEQCRFFEWAASTSTGIHTIQMRGSRVDQGRRARSNSPDALEEEVVKRLRSGVGVVLELELESIDKLTFRRGFNWTDEMKRQIKGFQGLECKKTEFLGVQKVILPIDKVHEFERFVEANLHVTVEYKIPRSCVGSVLAYRESEKRREMSGDVVKVSLDKVLPRIMCDKLMDFQWEGIHFALKKGGRCLIGDDMGLGKTLQAIAIARVYVADWPMLIVCPSSLRLNWKEELLRWLEDDLQDYEINVIMSGKDIEKPMQRVNIVSYDLLRKVATHSLRLCNFIIADESHYLKSMSAKRSQALTPVLKGARRALLLSGTPALSRPVELFPQINAISPTLFPKYQDFVRRYCNAHMGRFGLDVSGASNLDELHTLLRGSLLIRRKKEEVLNQLPEKQRQIIWVQTKSKIMSKVSKTMARFEAAKAEADNASSEREAFRLSNVVKGIQNELYNLTGEAKLEAVMEFCKDTAETGCKFIVFMHHGEVMDKLDDYCTKKLKLGRIRIDGKTAQGLRQGFCREFQENPECRVALLSITAAGVGLTLTKATVVVFAELYWNPGSLLQAEDRAHRIGQRDCVLVKYLLAKKTLDESMWSTVRRKLTVVGHSLTGSAARMELTEKESKKPSAACKGSIANIFRPNSAQERDDPGDDDVIEVVIEPTQTVQSVTQTQNSLQPTEKISRQGSVFPTSLSELEASPRPCSIAANDHHEFGIPTDADLDEALTKKAQMDADIAFARKLQAQFDAER